MRNLTVIAFAKRPEFNRNDDMAGVMEMIDIKGSDKLTGNPLDLDVLNPNDNTDFVNASGFLRNQIAQGSQARQQRKDTRQSSKAAKRESKGQAKVLSATAKTKRADAKNLEGKAQIEAAKSSAQTNLNIPTEPIIQEKEGMGRTTKIVLVVLGIGVAITGVVLAVKHFKKGKKS